MCAGGFAALGLVVASAFGQAPSPEVRAVRIAEPPRVDGILDEPFWREIPPVTGFLQREPVDGAAASENTELRIAYDESSLYFGLTLKDREPGRIRRAILERGGRIDKDDRIIIGLDTFLDRRNAYIFEVGALGTQDDALLSDEQLDREDWNWDGVFTTETTVNAEGWVLEMAIPFTTIRFADTEAPVMGIAVQRSIRRKNETVVWPHIGQEYRSGIAQVSRYATLTGLSGVRRGRHLEVKPYATLGAHRPGGADEFARESRGGGDLKYRLTPGLTLDLTWNTDFAQVESDNVQINLTRFDLFFPEKREFFLERASLFSFGAPRDTEVFFSRRVGLDGDIRGGGRLTGQAGPLTVGALALRSGGDGAGPPAWNSVIRLQGNLGERTTVGTVATSLDAEGGSNRVVGADLRSRFWSSSGLRLWGARSFDTGDAGDEDRTAASAELRLENDLWAFELGRIRVGPDFAPGLGFVRRPDRDEWAGEAEFKPRFEGSGWARRGSVLIEADRITDTRGEVESRAGEIELIFELESGEGIEVGFEDEFERLHEPASISGRELPPGDYRFRTFEVDVWTNDSRPLAAFVGAATGGFWGGERDRFQTGLAWITGPHLTLGATVSRNRVSLPVAGGDFTTTILGLDLDAAVSRKLFAGALLQWDNLSRELQANIRVDWIHTPGSDLFLVLDTGYLTEDPLDPRAVRWTRRTGVVKLTWLKAF